MRLFDIATTLMSGATARLRRNALALAVAAVCVLIAVAMLVSAAVMALEPEVGGVYARLIVGGAFVLLAGGTILWLQVGRAERRTPLALGASAADSKDTLRRQAQFAQIAMIVEAVMIGYSLSRRAGRR